MKLLTRLLTWLMLCSVAYGQIPITGLPPAHLPLAGTEIVPMVQGPNTVQTAISNIFATSAPSNAPFLLEAATAALANARVLTGGTNIILTDGGPGGNFTVATVTNPTFTNLTLTADTGILIGNGATPVSVFGGITCTGGQVISAITATGGGTCVTAGAPLANPTATIGLTVINGSATTAMRSDAAPPLSQAISPTWTGNHVWSPTSGVGGIFNGVAGSQALDATGNATSGQSFGLSVFGGTTSGDYSVRFGNQAATANFEEIFGDGHGFLGPNGTNNLQWNTAGNFTINTPTSGGPLILDSPDNTTVITATDTGTPTSGIVALEIFHGATAIGWFGSGGDSGGAALTDMTFASVNALNLFTNSQIREKINSSGNATINAPSSGTALTVDAASGNDGIVVLGASGAASGIMLTGQISGTHSWEMIADANSVAGQWGLFNDTATAQYDVLVNVNNQWTWNAPTAGGQSNFTFNGRNGNNLMTLSQAAGAGGAFGLNIQAGTNASDYALLIKNQANATTFAEVFGDGSGVLGNNGSANTITFAANGGVTIAQPSGATNALTVTAPNTQNAARFNGGATTGQSFGILNEAGTNSSDRSALFTSQAGASYLLIRGDGAIQGFGVTNNNLVDMSPDVSSFTATFTGFSAGTTTETVFWSKQGNQVMIWVPAFTNANSNTTSFTMTGIPAEIQPAHGGGGGLPLVENNTSISNQGGWTVSGGTATFYTNGAAAGFTAAGTKGLPVGVTLAYNIN